MRSEMKRNGKKRHVLARGMIEGLEERRLLSTVVVNTIVDQMFAANTGLVSLRNAVATANGSGTPTTITFDPTVFATAKTITLNGSSVYLSNGSQRITIIGPAAGLTISGNDQSGVLDICVATVVDVSGVILTHGKNGHGAVNNDGTLFLHQATVSNSIGYPEGGGIVNHGTATLTDVTVSGNTAIYGGGIQNEGTMSLTGCTVSGNWTTGMTGVWPAWGAGIINGGMLTLTNTTLSGNSGVGGPALWLFQGLATLTNVTISGNSGTSALYTGSANAITIANSIVAGNSDGDVEGIFTSLGGNVIGSANASSGWIGTDRTGTQAAPLDAKLGALRDNGGATYTMMPLSGSPAIDHGSNALVPSGITTDQRGRARIARGTVDSGAVEAYIAGVSVSDAGGTYNGSAFPASGSVTGPLGEDLGTPTFTYYVGSNTSGTNLGSAAPSNAGTYTVVGSYAGDADNQAASSGPVTFTIARADATIVVNGYSGVYDAAAHGLSGSAMGVGGENLGSLLGLGASYVNGGSHVVTWTFAGNSNYKPATSTASVTITKAAASVAITGYSGTYDGAAHGLSGSATGVSGENLGGLLSLGATHSLAGHYTATWSFAGNANYSAASGSGAVDISKANATIAIDSYSGVFDGDAHGLSGGATGASGEDLGGLLSLGATYSLAGHYTANWSFAGTANYNAASGSGAVDISKADATIVVKGYSGTYDGISHAASGTIRGVNGEDVGGLCTWGASFIDAPGGTTTWWFSGDDNYNPASGSVSVNIDKATPAVWAGHAGGVCSGLPIAASGSVSGVRGQDLGVPTFTYYVGTGTGGTNLGSTAPSAAGIYTVVGAYAGNTNYVAASGNPVSFFISAAAPANVSSSAVGARIKLVWTYPFSGQSGFTITRSTDGTHFSKLADVAPGATSYKDAAITPGASYYYRIRANSVGGNSGWTMIWSAGAANLTATAVATGQINLAWDYAYAGQSGFRIERSTDGSTFEKLRTVGPAVRSWQDSGLTAGTTYYYRVRANGAIANSSFTAPVAATTMLAVPRHFTLSVISSTEIDLSWTYRGNGATGFRIERSEDGVNFTRIAGLLDPNATSFQDEGLTAGTKYYYHIRANGVYGHSAYSAVVSAST